MFEEIKFEKINRLPKYVFASINEIKTAMRQAGEDVIDFSMGNPDGMTPSHIVEKLCECAKKPKNQGYSVSKGIYKLREAIAKWYERKYHVFLDTNKEVCVCMGSKEGYAHLIQAIAGAGDSAIVPEPAYPIHYYAFILNGANVIKFPIKSTSGGELDQDVFFASLQKALSENFPKPKFVVVNFPHNPTTTIVHLDFYQKLVDLARKERFYIISDIAYADLCFDGYQTPSILQIEGAKDVAVETYTLSKSYNMAGWRIGFVVGNQKMIKALQDIKSWLDYGLYTPLQVAATSALNGDEKCVAEIRENYKNRIEVIRESFSQAGWELPAPKASMFIWAPLPKIAQKMGSLEFSKRLLQEAKIALSPGVGFSEYGEGYVRIALIENAKRIRQAGRNLKVFLKKLENENA